MAKDRKKRERALTRERLARSRLPVDASKLNMGNTYASAPEFYEDRAFVCRDCGISQTWTATQQKWWYEDVGGYFFAIAIRCRECRAKERERIAVAREGRWTASKHGRVRRSAVDSDDGGADRG